MAVLVERAHATKLNETSPKIGFLRPQKERNFIQRNKEAIAIALIIFGLITARAIF